MVILAYRALIRMSGTDRADFLQGIVTNNINLLSDDSLLYALMLTHQGKMLYDFFILGRKDHYLIDIPAKYMDEIIKKFNMYKLQSDIRIDILNNMKVVISQSSFNDGLLSDPRSHSLSYYRGFMEEKQVENQPDNLLNYHIERINLKIPELSIDFMPGERFALELNMDQLNAINYQKGCYIGQEVTARTTYRGTVRKGIYKISFKSLYEAEKILPGAEIFVGEELIGQAMQPFGINCLAILYKEKVQEVIEKNLKLQLNSVEVFIN
ncbi:MAG: Folate-binding protein YgfZ, synthesis and repair of Fe-S clusters [Candidatus Midichloria mitochondrii]|nr:hypothetical protein [Candidatus Midichloria mitochondrii]MDJ1288327.1 hypothetical protein [Candidatus Midichloria mitochondrii]MDJ1299521.1 hypothetical protein [Candidatus Midichloria mitochondrii]MDJ1313267.1 hypothetical protein [Candidatus Midichloria mitochondrii]MDJ1583857.1 hypothetical protein [Candidatus Midichloria mitochondrii]